jgi:hypothetical protein
MAKQRFPQIFELGANARKAGYARSYFADPKTAEVFRNKPFDKECKGMMLAWLAGWDSAAIAEGWVAYTKAMASV